MLKILFSKDYEKKIFDAIVNKSSSIIADKIVSVGVIAEEEKLKKEKSEKDKIINIERIRCYFEQYRSEIKQNNNGIPKIPIEFYQMTTEESKLVAKHIIEERKAHIAAKASISAAKVRGVFSLFATSIAAGTAYWYFRPIQDESEKNKREIEEFKKKFFSAHADSICQKDIVKKAEELIYSDCNKINIDIYEQYKTIKEKERLHAIDRIPADEAYNILKATNKSYDKLKFK
jgi:hypothetical protein